MDASKGPGVIDAYQVEDICRQNDIAFLGVFGSYARGDYTDESDIDLLVRFSKQKSLFDLVRIEDKLSARLGKPVDLVVEGGVSPYLRDRIMSEVRPIYEAA
jgi:predicted nucleotidyltransferase